MTNEEFKVWLCGYIVLTQDFPLNENQIRIIKNHANLAAEVDGYLSEENQRLIDNISVGDLLSQYMI